MAAPLTARPQLLAQLTSTLKTIPTRVLRTPDSASDDAQRVSQVGFVRTNDAIAQVNGLLSTPYGGGQMLTAPNGSGGRTETLAIAGGYNTLAHTLGYPSSGFVVVDLQASRQQTAGAFHDTTTQTAAVANTAYALTFNATDLSSGVSLGTPTSRMVVDTPGVYDVQFSAQLDRTSATNGNIWIWVRVNGADVANSAGQIRIQGNNAETIAAWNYLLSLNAGDYVQIMWAADDTNSRVQAIGAAGVVPDIPSVIATVANVSGGVQIYRVPQTAAEDQQTIKLYAQAPCSAKIWVW